MDNITDLMIKENVNTLVNIESPYINNGIQVPRVTQILSAMLHENYLMKWSNALGLFQRKKYEEFLQDAADKGTYVHEAINRYLLTGEVLDTDTLEYATVDQKNAASNGFNSFLSWWKSNENILQLVSTEMEITCPYFGGTCDLLVSSNGKNFLLDFKTSKQTGYKHFLQLAAYRYILQNYYNMKIDGVGILLLNKSKIKVEEYILDLSVEQNQIFIRQAEHTFMALAYAYYNRLKTQELFEDIF